MSGMVFHPGHQELHGITVVLETTGPVTYVGRFDNEDARGVHLLNVAEHHRASSPYPLEEFLALTQKFGVKAERKHLVVASGLVGRIRKLGELGG
jgi:hypothetical protein